MSQECEAYKKAKEKLSQDLSGAQIAHISAKRKIGELEAEVARLQKKVRLLRLS
jgi:hypothetical protein